MGIKRAPICPALSLPEAIEKAERIYSVVGKNTFNGKTAVLHMGYNGLNGASRRALGALRSFGLIRGRGANLAISDDAVVIIADKHSPNQEERQESLVKAVRHNPVFRDLGTQFGQGSTLPAITSLLQKKFGFKASSAKKTAKKYRDSIAIINWNKVEAAVADPTLHYLPLESKPANEFASRSIETKEDIFVLGKSNATLLWPQNMSPQEFEDFTDWLLLMHRKIARDVSGGGECVLEKKYKGVAV